MNTPVLFIIFKRYDTALQVFNAIRNAKPKRLYVAADGPRSEVVGEEEDCKRTRDIIKLVDWECEVKTLFHEKNQGCGVGPYKAITWFFENEEQGIILEDDCLPHHDFFGYCEELLNRYKDDERMTLITGRNNFNTKWGEKDSYFLSAWHFCWGWASWRRVWKQYDYTLKNITPTSYFRALISYFGLRNWPTILWRMNIYYFCRKNQPKDIWDYQFCITTQMRGGYTLVPSVNLIRNIGTDERATHTAGFTDSIPVDSILPLKHPIDLRYNRNNDVRQSRPRFNSLREHYYYLRNIFGL